MQDNGLIEIKDFSYDPEPKRFRLYRDGAVLEAAPQLPLEAMDMASKLAKQAKTLATDDPAQAIDMMIVFLKEILLPDSVTELVGMIGNKVRPLSATMMMDVFIWLMESYGLRPTEPSSVSSTSSPDDGSITLTGGVSLGASTSTVSGFLDSSTSSTSTSTNAVADS